MFNDVKEETLIKLMRLKVVFIERFQKETIRSTNLFRSSGPLIKTFFSSDCYYSHKLYRM